jgi:murein DD-endopeptidase MepM/ murein hydrolase activator NlpD
MLFSFAAIPLAAADDLEDRKKRVQGNISSTLKDLDQSSRQLAEATRVLEQAQSQLSQAEARLARTQGKLAVARVLDRQMQAKLDAAIERLRKARAELAQGEEDVEEQERTLGQIAVSNYQSGNPSLMGLAMVLNSKDPSELTSQLGSVQSLMEKETVTLDRLEASRIILTVQEQEVEAAKVEVAKQRRAAARNLERKRKLVATARRVRLQVRELVLARRAARAAAVQAREADLRRLDNLQQERDRISEILRRRAEAARRRAAAAAAAAAAKAQAQAHGSNGYLSMPVDGYITSSYGMRFHPVYKQWSLHDGTDFGAGCGTPIRAAASGRVIAVYYNAGYGNRVIIDNGYARGVGLGTAYNHLSRYSTYVGEKVKRGEVIGYVGNTGFSTGCHLHFMVFENGTAVDPMGWL